MFAESPAQKTQNRTGEKFSPANRLRFCVLFNCNSNMGLGIATDFSAKQHFKNEKKWIVSSETVGMQLL